LSFDVLWLLCKFLEKKSKFFALSYYEFSQLFGSEEICPYLLTSHVLAERVEYMEDTFASASSEFCAPGGSYFGYSVFPGVMLRSLMHTPESLFQTCNSFY
jgi:hypothetical protein